MSLPRATLAAMVKFDPEGFMAMMARIEAEARDKERQAATLRSPYEDLEPDFDYMPVRPR